MKREEYLDLRTTHRVDLICYEYYKEHFNKEKHKEFFDFDRFISYIQEWINQGFNNTVNITSQCLSYYDIKFNILTVPAKQPIYL